MPWRDRHYESGVATQGRISSESSCAVGFGHLSPNQVCENELAETMQVIGSQRVRERGEEGQGTPAAAAVSRVPLSPLARSLGPCLLLHILRSSGASLSLSLAFPHRSARPVSAPARPPEWSVLGISSGRRPWRRRRTEEGREGRTPAKHRPLTPCYAARAILSLSFGKSQLTLCSLPPSISHACAYISRPKDRGQIYMIPLILTLANKLLVLT